ncbi:TonB-dependent receptor [Sesbania bispinosa]|nr:TonB-dependent receptor [Sesbania bispinosa]
MKGNVDEVKGSGTDKGKGRGRDTKEKEILMKRRHWEKWVYGMELMTLGRETI